MSMYCNDNCIKYKKCSLRAHRETLPQVLWEEDAVEVEVVAVV